MYPQSHAYTPNRIILTIVGNQTWQILCSEKLRITWKGEWSASNSYSEQDVVRDGADTYICIGLDGIMGAQTGLQLLVRMGNYSHKEHDISTTKGGNCSQRSWISKTSNRK